MGNYTIFLKFENPRRGRQARNLSENDPKTLDLKSSSEQIIFRKLSLGAPDATNVCSRDGDVLLRTNTLEDDLHTRDPLLLKTKLTSILPPYVRSMG